MKRYLLFLILSVFVGSCNGIYGKDPGQMSYQASVRDATCSLVKSKPVSMQKSILVGRSTGSAVYRETQSPITNENRLISINIGAGTVKAGDFTGINWRNSVYFLKTEISLTGDADYPITSTNQMLSLPYAMSAQTASVAPARGNQNCITVQVTS